MNNVDDLYGFVDSHASHVMFEYKGKSCGIDPFCDTNIDMWYGEKCETFTSIESVFSTPFFDGKTIADIFAEVRSSIEY